MIFSHLFKKKKNRLSLERIYPKHSKLTDLGKKSVIIISTCAALHEIWLLSDIKDTILHYKIKNKQEESIDSSLGKDYKYKFFLKMNSCHCKVTGPAFPSCAAIKCYRKHLEVVCSYSYFLLHFVQPPFQSQ